MPYEIHLFDSSNNRVAILQEEILTSADLVLSISAAPTLTISMPLSEAKSSFISPLYYAKIYNDNAAAYEHSVFELVDPDIEDSESGLQIKATYQGILTRLSDEHIDTYDTGSAGDTFTNVITDILAFQVNTPAITVGTLEPTPTVAIALESTDIYSALNSIRDAYGGWFEVDSLYRLNWYNDNTGDPMREIRRSKNLKSLKYTPQYSRVVNRVYAYGKGESTARINLTDAGEAHEYIEDAASQTTYGVRAKKYIDKSITHPATLLAYAQRILAEYKNPPYQYSVDVVNLAEVADYDYSLESLGLDTRIRVIDDLLSVDVDTSIVSMSINLLAPEEISVELNTVKNDLSDLFKDVLNVQDIQSSVATQIGAGQVTVLGTVTVIDWASSGTTTIDGGSITTNTITTAQLNFTPATSTNVIATINASSEGIAITADRITLAGVVSVTNDIKSSNYSAGSAGWIIDGDGSAEFNNVTVRGTLAACTVGTGEKITVNGTMQCGGITLKGVGFNSIEIEESGLTGKVRLVRTSINHYWGDLSFSAYSGGISLDDDGATMFSATYTGNVTLAGTLNVDTIDTKNASYITFNADINLGTHDITCDDITCDDINCGGDLFMSGASGGGNIKFDDSSHYLYKSGDDLYYYDGSTSTKLN